MGSTKMRSTIHDPYDPYDPCDPLTAASFPKAEGLFRTAFKTISHSWMLGMCVICFRLQFLLQLIICSSRRGQKEVIFAKTAQAYFSCAQDVKLYSCLHHQSSESTLPNYESRTWDAKTRKLLSYQIVISGKIQHFRTLF